MPPISKETPPSGISTLELISRLSNSPTLGELAKNQRLYPQGLLNNRPEDPVTLASALAYALKRVPFAILSGNLQGVELSGDTSEFMKVEVNPAVTIAHQTSSSVRTDAPGRSRWHLINPTANGPIVSFHTRNPIQLSEISLQHFPTDTVEILSFLGTIEQVRLTALRLRTAGEDITPIEEAYAGALNAHINDQIIHLQRVAQVKTIVQQSTEAEINEREQLEEQLRQLRLFKDQVNVQKYFEEWLNREDVPVLLNSNVNNKEFLEFWQVGEMMSKSIAEALETKKLAIPEVVLFGNDFSIRLLMAVGLYTESEFDYLRRQFQKNLSSIQFQLDNLKSQDEIYKAAEKFFLIQQLSIYQGESQMLYELQTRLFSTTNFAKMGIIRLVETENSCLADPVDFFDPTKVDRDVMENLPAPVYELIQALVNRRTKILSVPYTLGELTRQMLTALTNRFEKLRTIAFIGKVGCLSRDSSVKVGDLVLPIESQHPLFENELKTNLVGTEGIADYPQHYLRTLSTLGLTTQQVDEMLKVLNESKDKSLALDMELYYLLLWWQALSEEQQTMFSQVIRYYVSDITHLSDQYEAEKSEKEKISSMGPTGVVPLFLALFLALNDINKVEQEKR